MLVITCPVGDGGGDVEEDLESNLAATEVQLVFFQNRIRRNTCLRNHFCCLFEIATSAHIGLGKEVLNQAHPSTVAHSIELFVHLHIVTIVITAQLSDDGSVCQGDQFGVDFVNSGSGLVSEERQITMSTTIWHSSIG